MSIKVTIKKYGKRAVTFEIEGKSNSRDSPENREAVRVTRERLKTQKKASSVLDNKLVPLVKKQGSSIDETLNTTRQETQKSKKSKKSKKSYRSNKMGKAKKTSERTIYLYGGKAISSIVSGGGGPGTGRRR